MEVIRTVGSVMGSIKMLVDLIEINKKRRCELARGLKSMNMDFEMITSVRLRRKGEQLQLAPALQLKLQELVYDIDDFIQGLWVPGELGSFILSAIGADSRPGLVERVGDFKERIKNLKEELPKSFEPIPSGGTSRPAGPAAAAGSPVHYAREVDLVGIKGSKKKIVELLYPQVEPHVGRLSVICIVGCSGSGKTALARALYEDEDVVNKFDFKSWVVASDPSSADIVNKIRQEVVLTSPTGSTPEALYHFQKEKRYLVFVDDVLRETPLMDIKNSFSENVMDSRIIVTTRVPSITRDYISGSYEYAMQGLDQENARKLFRVKFRGMAGYTEEDKHRLGNNDVDIIIDKCDGLPIALISAAECLRRKGPNPESGDFKKVSEELRDNLACCDSAFEEFQKQNGPAITFAEMRRACVEPYENLLNHGEKECLLYVSIFPCGYHINSKNLVRRLVAEGLVPGDPDIVKASESVARDVRDCVWKLMDQRMIEPVPIRNYSNVAKRCRAHSIMLQFTIKKAASRNFMSQIYNDDPLHSVTGLVRRLTVQSSPHVGTTGPPEGIGLSVVRSLAIFDSGILNLEDCRLVRVLDLEGCLKLSRKDLDNICGLLFLKFLSLRNTGILELPQNVMKLKFLEMLDIRDTRYSRGTVGIKLPVEVLTLPRLAYLFGKFELTNVHTKNTKELTKFFSEKVTHLHTLGGIVVHETKGLDIVLLVIQYATKLKKVKMWYRHTPSSTIHVRASTPAASGTAGLPGAGPLEDSRSNVQDPAQDSAPTACTLVPNGTKGLPSADSSSNAQDPTPAISTTLANGTPDQIACASRRDKKKHFGFFRKLKLSTGPAANPTSIPATSTPVASGTPGLPFARPLAASNSNAQDPAQTTLVVGGTPVLPSTRPSAESNSNAHEPTTAISTSVANDTQKPIACATRQGMIEHMKKPFGFFSKREPSAAQASNPLSNTHGAQASTSTTVARGTDSNSVAQDPAPTTSTPSSSSAGSSADSSSNAQAPASATSTTVSGGTPEPFPCVSRLAETLKKRYLDIESVSVDFNGVPNTFLDFLHTGGTISSIKLRRGQGNLAGPDKLGNVEFARQLRDLCNLKKLHLFSTGLKSEQLASLQHLKCLKYLKLAEDVGGLWDSVFHLQVGGFISLLWLCFESSDLKCPPLKIDQGVKTPLASLLLLCKENDPRVEGMSHLAKLNEVTLHRSATDDEVTAWKEEAKKHINMPYVEKQHV